MKKTILGRRAGSVLGCGFAAGALLFLARGALAQAIPQGDTATAPKAYKSPPLFQEAKPLEITLVAPLNKLKKHRVGNERPYYPATVSYVGDSGAVSIPVRVRVRGIWRRKNCDLPPIMVNFYKDSAKKTAFARLDRARLVLHCRNNDDFEQYVLQEYQLYRVQRLLTSYSLDVRLARVTYIDSEKKDTVAQRYGFLAEIDQELADRVGGKPVEIQGAGPDDLEPYENAFVGVWQYFVGNTDFSIRALHNVILLYKDPTHIPVAYDYDWSGAVNTRYARPNEIIGTRTVAQRVMRGLCAPPEQYEKVFALFKEKKDAIYALYSDSLAAALKPNVVKGTLKYFDEFYETINDPRAAKRNIVGACLRGAA
jgi:hypothetical protein